MVETNGKSDEAVETARVTNDDPLLYGNHRAAGSLSCEKAKSLLINHAVFHYPYPTHRQQRKRNNMEMESGFCSVRPLLGLSLPTYLPPIVGLTSKRFPSAETKHPSVASTAGDKWMHHKVLLWP